MCEPRGSHGGQDADGCRKRRPTPDSLAERYPAHRAQDHATGQQGAGASALLELKTRDAEIRLAYGFSVSESDLASRFAHKYAPIHLSAHQQARALWRNGSGSSRLDFDHAERQAAGHVSQNGSVLPPDFRCDRALGRHGSMADVYAVRATWRVVSLLPGCWRDCL